MLIELTKARGGTVMVSAMFIVSADPMMDTGGKFKHTVVSLLNGLHYDVKQTPAEIKTLTCKAFDDR